LFTLGLGHYTEDDVRAAARAFTGWVRQREEGYGGEQHFRYERSRLAFQQRL
jgi:uncharacterized protein (DUF1800 family)